MCSLNPHRVVNSDNTSIIGVTIDYGPFGFLDYYDPNYLSQSSGKWQPVNAVKCPSLAVLYLEYNISAQEKTLNHPAPHSLLPRLAMKQFTFTETREQ